ncbi:MAG: hypothetical protein HQ581_21345 [Planctomycetes bacterium]|nr:hypothetical protein [Planctomycetota bacterium]
MKWFRHAFAVNSDPSGEPTEGQRAVADRVCRAVVRRRMATPALMLLEMCRPLNYLSAQLMHFFGPVATVLLDRRAYGEFAAFLERRSSVDYLCRRIEALEAEADQPASPEDGPSCDSPAEGESPASDSSADGLP